MLEPVTASAPEKGKQEPKRPKLRIEPVRPNHVVDVWRLYEHFVRDSNRKYPDLSEETADTVQSHLFAFMQQPTFSGLQAKIGKKVVGIILGSLVQRPIGRPRVYLSVQCLWVDPAFRRKGIGMDLWKEYTTRIKATGVFNFEAFLTEEQAKKVPADRMATVVGGRI